MMKLVIFLMAFCFNTFIFANEIANVMSCQMQDGSLITVTKKENEKENGVNEFYLNSDKKSEKIFHFVEGLTDVNKIKCVSHLLIFTLEAGSPYVQSLIVRRVKNQLIEKIYVEGRSPPQKIYFNNKKLIIINPTYGLGEFGNKKFIVYKKYINSDKVHISYSNIMPKQKDFFIYNHLY